MNNGVLSSLQIVEAARNQQDYDYWKRKTEVGPDNNLLANELREAEDKPRIVISGFDPTPSHQGGRLNPGSYNLTLDANLLVYSRGVLNMRMNNPTEEVMIPETGLYLEPGRLYLGKTVEYTETYNLVPVLDGRSSIGRLGLFIHVTAGLGDRSFCGHWTLELAVVQPLLIFPNTQICQIRYFTTGPGWGYQGKYNNATGTPPEASRIWQEFCDDKPQL